VERTLCQSGSEVQQSWPSLLESSIERSWSQTRARVDRWLLNTSFKAEVPSSDCPFRAPAACSIDDTRIFRPPCRGPALISAQILLCHTEPHRDYNTQETRGARKRTSQAGDGEATPRPPPLRTKLRRLLRAILALSGGAFLAVLSDGDSSLVLEALEQLWAVPEEEEDFEPDEKDGEHERLQERVEQGGGAAFELEDGRESK
jgi:hypothetical protein